MYAFLEATWFVWWILTVIGVLRWFRNASQLDEHLYELGGEEIGQTLAFETGAGENQARPRAF